MYEGQVLIKEFKREIKYIIRQKLIEIEQSPKYIKK